MFDIPILINIFKDKNRIKNVITSFSNIKPKKVYIFQDGAKNKDIENQLNDSLQYAKSLITWDCYIYTYRLKENHGPAEGEIFAYQWVFKFEEMAIILEDDLVPNDSFFYYCDQMLKHFKDNPKISYISGINPYGTYSKDKDILFSTRGALCGWATWKRFIDTLDLKYDCTNRNDFEKIMLERCLKKHSLKKLNTKIKHLKEKSILDFEVIICLTTIFNDQFAIIPTKNLVMNCGIDLAAQNGASNIKKMPKEDQKNYYAKTYDLNFPLKVNYEIREEPGYRKRYDPPFYKRFFKLCSIALRKIFVH